ncbi:MAG TPA: MoaD/ThiS family protein [Rhodothermales bacterium]|nr:MoaD/ThiS family protein [Rhodothermales bacterium]
MPDVRLMLFSILREKVGRGCVELRLPDGATAGDAVDVLFHEHQHAAPLRSHVRIAVNCEYADGTCQLRDGDEVALITPVSGG